MRFLQESIGKFLMDCELNQNSRLTRTSPAYRQVQTKTQEAQESTVIASEGLPRTAGVWQFHIPQ